MKRTLICLMLSLSLLAALAGCGSQEEPSLQEAVPTACPHQWQEATFFSPRTCTLCGKTEGEPLEDYFTFNGLTLEKPRSFEFPMLIYHPIDADLDPTAENVAQYKNAPCTVTFDPIAIDYPGDGTQVIDYSYHIDGEMEIDVDGRVYDSLTYSWGFYDLYTGTCFNNLTDLEGDIRKGILNMDGMNLPFAFLIDESMAYGDPVFREGGRITMHYTRDICFTLTFPENYDGLVFSIEPMFAPNPEGYEDPTGLIYAMDDYIPGESRYFRINP